MEELKNEYYFKNINEFSESEIFEGTTYVWEVVNKINDYLDKKVVKDNIKVNNAKMGEYVSITGNYFIDEGTKIGSNVTIQGPVIIGKNVEIRSRSTDKARNNNRR